MQLTISQLVSGLKLQSFQGITVSRGAIVMATIEGDLLRISEDGTITPWVNVANYGIPTGIASLGDEVGVLLSGQESGHFLLQVATTGEIKMLADLSQYAGEFGAPFGLAVRSGDDLNYWVAISTDVVGSGGAVVQVTPTGQVNPFVRLPSSPFGIVVNADRTIVVTQENGKLLGISDLGKITPMADLISSGFGMPLAIVAMGADYLVTTTTGLVVQVRATGMMKALMNTTKAGFGQPNAITQFESDWIVATGTGRILRLSSALSTRHDDRANTQ